jgi:hypothetical protein
MSSGQNRFFMTKIKQFGKSAYFSSLSGGSRAIFLKENRS